VPSIRYAHADCFEKSIARLNLRLCRYPADLNKTAYWQGAMGKVSSEKETSGSILPMQEESFGSTKRKAVSFRDRGRRVSSAM
jgi:hypothetical protein